MSTPYICLQGVGPQLQGRAWETHQRLRIGRSPYVEIKLMDDSISRCHAEVLYSERGWVVRDFGSTNGTFLNGIRVGQVERTLQERDLVQCGSMVFVVAALWDATTEPAETLLGNLQIEASTQHSWEEALQIVALDLTRRSQSGEQLLGLLRAGQHLCQAASLDQLLELCVQDAATMMDAQQGSILLLDERTGKLTLRARSIRCEQLGDTPGASTTVASRCFARKESLLCNDVRCHPDLPTPSGNAGAMSSIICALLRTSHKILGVLHLDRSASQKPYALEDLHMADGIAAAMATTIASAQAIQEKRRNIFLQTVITLTHSLALRDAYTSGHAQRVTEYVLLLADELKLPSAERQCLQLAGPLHDIGKLGVEDAVLRKQDCLTPEEFDQMKSHPTKGVALLESIPDMAPILPIVRSHHERWDGQGYPDGLAGEQIPRLARMIAVADVFDVLTFDTPYRRSTSLEHAFAALQEGAGSQFDPECVDAFAQARPRLERCLHRSDKDIYRSVGSGI